MATLSEFSQAIEKLVADIGPQLRHLGSAHIEGRTALHWHGSHYISIAREAIKGEKVPLYVDGTKHEAEVVGFDGLSGLVVLSGPEAPGVVDFANASPRGLGAVAITVASASVEGTEVSVGVVRMKSARYLQTDSAAFPGFLGALVLDADGHIFGIQAEVGRGNRSWILPSDLVHERANILASGGDLSPARLGVSVETVPLNADTAAAEKQDAGLIVREVHDGSVASRLGIAAGDILLTLNGRRLGSSSSLLEELNYLPRTKKSALVSLRGSHTTSLVLDPDSIFATGDKE